MIFKILFASGLVALFSFELAWAIDFSRDRLTLGGTVRIESNNRIGNTYKGHYEEPNNYRFEPTGLIRFGHIEVNDKGLMFNFHNSLAFQSFVVANIEGDPYDNDTAISERKRSIFAGGGFRVYPLTLLYLYDVQGESEGALGRAYLQAPINTDKTLTLFTLAYSLYDKTYSNHYYGVSASEASADYPEFSGESGNDLYFNIKFIWYFKDKWALYTMAEAREYSQSIISSPTVNDELRYTGQLGFWYDFL